MKKRMLVRDTASGFRETLIERRRDALAGLDLKFDTLARLGRVAEDDQAQLTHDEYIALHMNTLDYAKLRLVEEALDRLERGDYGTCLSCGERIADKRLRAIPWAQYCLRCEEELIAPSQKWEG